jgi:hypothetical protein
MKAKELEPKPQNQGSRSLLRLPLRLILIASLVVPIAATVGLTGYLSFKNGQQAVEDLAQQLMAEVGDRIQIQVQSYLSNAQTINQLNANAIRSGQLDPQNPDALTQYFWQQRSLFNQVCGTAMYFGNPQGEFTGLGWHRPTQAPRKPGALGERANVPRESITALQPMVRVRWPN